MQCCVEYVLFQQMLYKFGHIKELFFYHIEQANSSVLLDLV